MFRFSRHTKKESLTRIHTNRRSKQTVPETAASALPCSCSITEPSQRFTCAYPGQPSLVTHIGRIIPQAAVPCQRREVAGAIEDYQRLFLIISDVNCMNTVPVV